eukprot:gnl/TRDRNA2_/TRDRNA2_93573_c0_seq1.p1 gnl/TRDRNA2_/TRDRNA2_93573_c0~~gnl/TRDRNA2_/TRDRNA2_93573_c0_seq1.p1  ORF type:complete len:257 (-),score=31.63 gnl/TRDRNA2_/TRDRNA2_93573_c0_seq1:54-824(-)
MAQDGAIVIAVPDDIAQKILCEGYRCSRRRRVPASRNREAALRAYRRFQPSRPPVLLEVVSLPANVATVPHKDGIKITTSHLAGDCLARVPRPGSAPPHSGKMHVPLARTPSVPPAAAVLRPPSWSETHAPPGSRQLMQLGQIFFSQDSILQNFRDGRALTVMEGELRRNEKTVRDIPTITVVLQDGRWHCVDNRRLYVFKRAFKECDQVPVMIGVRDSRFYDKFTTKNRGESVRIRSGTGGGVYSGNFGGGYFAF